MAETSKSEIVTPEAIVHSEDVEMVTLTSVEGQMGILPQHVALMTQLIPGEMIVRKAGRVKQAVTDLRGIGTTLFESGR